MPCSPLARGSAHVTLESNPPPLALLGFATTDDLPRLHVVDPEPCSRIAKSHLHYCIYLVFTPRFRGELDYSVCCFTPKKKKFLHAHFKSVVTRRNFGAPMKSCFFPIDL